MNTLDRIQDKIGTFLGVDDSPLNHPGMSSVTVMADIPTAQITDTSNWVRIDVEADNGEGWKLVKAGTEWNGGPGKSAPFTTYPFDPTHPPKRVRGVLVNGTRGVGSPAICGLIMTFA